MDEYTIIMVVNKWRIPVHKGTAQAGEVRLGTGLAPSIFDLNTTMNVDNKHGNKTTLPG
jgi:hypothetical protein